MNNPEDKTDTDHHGEELPVLSKSAENMKMDKLLMYQPQTKVGQCLAPVE